MSKFWTIFAQSFKTKAQTKSFIITTVVVVFAIFLLANISSIIEKAQQFGGEDNDNKIAVVDHSGELFTPFQQQLALQESSLELVKTDKSVDSLKKLVSDGDFSSILELDLDAQKTIQVTYTSESANDVMKPQEIQEALQAIQTSIKAEGLNLTGNEVNELFAPIQFDQQAIVKNSRSEEELSEARGLVYVLIFVIYFSVIYYSNMIAMEVATEKSSRVMEIMISSVSPVKHMFAKILGVGTLGLLQIAIYGLAGYFAIKTSSSDMTSGFFQYFGFSNVAVSTIVFAVIFFLLGYFLYATLAALLGSLVSRTEDVQQLIMPMTFIIIIAAFISFSGLGNPEAAYVTYTSYFPFFTPLVMFLRVGMLDLPIWEPILGVAILVVSIAIMGYFGARVYRGGVLMYGPSQSLKDIKKAIQLGKS
ncbi:ABC transporter permease [Paenisporosarcina cavernae]|uniref:ABC transporter permease n=1 Tax=Paenisporosarcina cavernae TaxID=2320858 RepID=A0A385YWW7_9BACL|nr:ABC transporter permease [Paenisporosarcina cavernae]AYC30178.1 ABC transporter permease [Paenisporosarcina cavernae]